MDGSRRWWRPTVQTNVETHPASFSRQKQRFFSVLGLTKSPTECSPWASICLVLQLFYYHLSTCSIFRALPEKSGRVDSNRRWLAWKLQFTLPIACIYNHLHLILKASSPPFIRCSRGWGLSTPSTNLGLAAQGVTLSTPLRSIQCCSLATGKSQVIWK